MTKKNSIFILIGAALIVVGFVFIYYRKQISLWIKEQTVVEEPVMKRGEEITEQSREISANASYTSPAGSHTDRFSLFLNEKGQVIDVKATDTIEPGSTHESHLSEFAEGLLVVIKGKKLSELEPVDRIGSSSLTTTAFNEALMELKSL